MCQIFTYLSVLKITNQYTDSPVSKTEMGALTVFSTLLNNIPFFKVGFLGRAAWLRNKHNLSYLMSMVIAIEIILLTFFSCLLVLSSVLISNVFSQNYLPYVFLFLILILASFFSTRHKVRSCVLFFRTIEIFLIVFKYFYLFSIFSIKISFFQCAFVGVISVFLVSVPFFSGGAGIREWGIAIFITFFSQPSGETPVVFAEILFIDLIMRGLEILMLIILGIPFGCWLLQKRKLP